MEKPKLNPELKIVKPKFSERFKSKNAPTSSGVQTLQEALPIYKIGEVDDWTKLHKSEDEYWTGEMCFVEVPVEGSKKRTMLHTIDDDLAVMHLSAKKIKRFRLALATKPNNKFFWCRVPSQNLDNAYNADAVKACYMAQTRWIQASSRQDGKDGYEIKFARNEDAFVETTWPTRSIDELLEVTFEEVNIEHDRHPGLLRLIAAKQDLT